VPTPEVVFITQWPTEW